MRASDESRERANIKQIKAELLLDLRKEDLNGDKISDELYERLKSFSLSYSFNKNDGPFWATMNYRMKVARRENLTPIGLDNPSAGARYMANFKAFVALLLEALSDIGFSAALVKEQGGLLSIFALSTGLLSICPILYGFFSATHGFSRFAMVTITPVVVAVLATDVSDGLYLLAVRNEPIGLGDYFAFSVPVLVPVLEMLVTCGCPKMYNTCSQALLIQSIASPIVSFFYGFVFVLDQIFDIDSIFGEFDEVGPVNNTTETVSRYEGSPFLDGMLCTIWAVGLIFASVRCWKVAREISNQEKVSDFQSTQWKSDSFIIIIMFLLPTFAVITGGNLRGIVFLSVLLFRTVVGFLFIMFS